MPMEEYHRADVLSAIRQVCEENYPYTDCPEVVLHFAKKKRLGLNWSVTRTTLQVYFSDYVDMNTAPASFFATAVARYVFGKTSEEAPWDARTKEFFASDEFRTTMRPVYFERNHVTKHLGYYDGLPVYEAGVYDVQRSESFGCILIPTDLTLEELRENFADGVTV